MQKYLNILYKYDRINMNEFQKRRRGQFMEIERKFLVAKMPSLDGLKYDKIIQGYVSLSPEIRVRKKGDEYYICEKSDGYTVREEKERKTDEKTFDELFAKTSGRVIEKTRYYIYISPIPIVYSLDSRGRRLCSGGAESSSAGAVAAY